MKYVYLFFILLLLGCSKDIGNYDYKDINDIYIEGITDKVLYDLISFKDELVIKPTIKVRFSGEDLTGLSYEWKLIPPSGNTSSPKDNYIISREKDLVYRIIKNPGLYYGTFTVKDTKTGSEFQKRFFVNIRSQTSEGWAILCEENGEGRLDWIFNRSADEDDVIKSLWEGRPEHKMGKPISLNFFYDLQGSFRSANFEKGSFNLNSLTQTAGETTNMKYQFYTMPNQVDVRGGTPKIDYRTPEIMMLIDKKGDVYAKTDFSSLFDYPCNMVIGETNSFVASPYVAHYEWKAGFGSMASVVLYDQTNCRFVEFVSGSLNPSVANIKGSLFKPTDDHEMIFMETTMALESYALLKNKTTGKYYIYGFRIGRSGDNNQTCYSEVIGPDLDKLNKVSFHNLNNYMFYSTDNKVYRFKIPNDASSIAPAEEVISLPGEEIVEIMSPKFGAWTAYQTWELDRSNRLVVASNKIGQSTDCGNIRIYDVPSLNQPLVLFRDYIDKGIGKIVDIEYFERGK